MSATARQFRFRAWLIGACVVVGLFASLLLRGQPTINRLERLLDRNPSQTEVVGFIERNGLPHSVVPKGQETVIYTLIDTCPIPFDSAKCYQIYFNANSQMTGYASHSESVAP